MANLNKPSNTGSTGGRKATWIGLAVLASAFGAALVAASPDNQGPIPGYHAEFQFSPALDTSGVPFKFVFDSGDHVTITTTLYDAYGNPLDFISGAISTRASLIFNVTDAAGSVQSISVRINGTVSPSQQNVATFTASRAQLLYLGAATYWVVHVISPNLYGFTNNGLHVGEGGNCMHQSSSSGSGGGIGQGILCAESYYSDPAAAAFASGDTHGAATLDETGTVVLAEVATGGSPSPSPSPSASPSPSPSGSSSPSPSSSATVSPSPSHHPGGGGGGGGGAGGPGPEIQNGPAAPPEVPPSVFPSPEPGPTVDNELPAAASPVAHAASINWLWVVAATLFLSTSAMVFRGLSIVAPLRWITVEEILPPATQAWLEFLDPQNGETLQEAFLTKLEDPESGAVLWAYEGYLAQRSHAGFRVMYRDELGLVHEAGPAPVEVKIEVDGIPAELGAVANAMEAPLEVLTV